MKTNVNKNKVAMNLITHNKYYCRRIEIAFGNEGPECWIGIDAKEKLHIAPF